MDVLQSIADQQTELVETTNSNNSMAEKIMDRFPANIYEEDVILFSRALEDFAPFESIPSVGIGGPVSKFTFENIAAQTDEEVKGFIPAEDNGSAPATEEGGEGASDSAGSAPQSDALPQLYVRNITISGKTDYDGFKNAIKFIADNTDRSNMVVNATYDIETGMLNASSNMERYSETGTGKVYVEPDIPGVIQGTDNIFGTIPIESRNPIRNSTSE